MKKVIGRPAKKWLPSIIKKASPEVKKLLEKWKDITESIAFTRGRLGRPYPFPAEPFIKEPAWKIPEPFAIKLAPVGAIITKEMNPNIAPLYEAEEIRDQLMECIDAGACSIHVHVRTPEGLHTMDPALYHVVVDPIKEKYGRGVLIDGCPEGGPGATLEESIAPLIEFKDVIETAPISVMAVYWSDVMFAVTKESVQSHVEIMQELGQKPEIVVHDTGSIEQARDWIIDTGIYKPPVLWRICIGAPHLTVMHNTESMFQIYHYCIRRIMEIAPDSSVLISMCGHGALHQMAFAAMYGPPVIGVRIGMEDSLFMYAHKPDLIPDNLTLLNQFITILKALGRRPATADEFRKMIGPPLTREKTFFP